MDLSYVLVHRFHFKKVTQSSLLRLRRSGTAQSVGDAYFGKVQSLISYARAVFVPSFVQPMVCIEHVPNSCSACLWSKNVNRLGGDVFWGWSNRCLNSLVLTEASIKGDAYRLRSPNTSDVAHTDQLPTHLMVKHNCKINLSTEILLYIFNTSLHIPRKQLSWKELWWLLITWRM